LSLPISLGTPRRFDEAPSSARAMRSFFGFHLKGPSLKGFE